MTVGCFPSLCLPNRPPFTPGLRGPPGWTPSSILASPPSGGGDVTRSGFPRAPCPWTQAWGSGPALRCHPGFGGEVPLSVLRSKGHRGPRKSPCLGHHGGKRAAGPRPIGGRREGESKWGSERAQGTAASRVPLCLEPALGGPGLLFGSSLVECGFRHSEPEWSRCLGRHAGFDHGFSARRLHAIRRHRRAARAGWAAWPLARTQHPAPGSGCSR